MESGSWTEGPEVVWLPPEYDFEEREYTQTPVCLPLTLVCWLEGVDKVITAKYSAPCSLVCRLGETVEPSTLS